MRFAMYIVQLTTVRCFVQLVTSSNNYNCTESLKWLIRLKIAINYPYFVHRTEDVKLKNKITLQTLMNL